MRLTLQGSRATLGVGNGVSDRTRGFCGVGLLNFWRERRRDRTDENSLWRIIALSLTRRFIGLHGCVTWVDQKKNVIRITLFMRFTNTIQNANCQTYFGRRRTYFLNLCSEEWYLEPMETGADSDEWDILLFFREEMWLGEEMRYWSDISDRFFSPMFDRDVFVEL